MSKATFRNLPFINIVLTATFKANNKTPDKSHRCAHCSKHFTRPSALKTHTYTHTGEKPFLCDVSGCGRRFTVASNLRRHWRVHQPHLGRRMPLQQRISCLKRLVQRKNSTDSSLSDSSLSTLSSLDSAPASLEIFFNDYPQFRLLKPKVEYIRPECLNIKHLLN